MAPILVRQYVVSTWNRGRPGGFPLKHFSKLCCEHVIAHGPLQRTVRQQVRHPFPSTGEKVVCRRCTMAARKAAK